MNSIYQPCSLTGSTPSGSTNQTGFLDPMLARLSSPSGFGNRPPGFRDWGGTR
ncbi:hypothetical protein PSTT_11961 [Puccinia striiformis]|uniref:Uncharacterized protein n=1 Tax=Puccinia striiformis TaxID=27350 RepID=A0A2S4UXZ6_9BASI|nr:hypothetical protein PSTT_11961 [Puccinia striiformis]